MIDYLSLLPIELWRKIFRELPIYRTIDATQSEDPLMFQPAENFNYIETSRKQKSRITLMPICKAMYPLLEELLYSDVLLSSEQQILTFITGLSASERRRFGNFTRSMRIHLMDTPDSELVSMLDDLKSTCPNISSLQIFNLTNGRQIDIWRSWLDSWSDTLVDLHWIDSGYQHYHMFDACKGLKRLHTLTARGNMKGADEEVVLPRVKRLRLRHFLTPSNTGAIFPSLESLQIQIDDKSEFRRLHNVIMKYEDTLRILEISGNLIGNEFMIASWLERTQLETLIMPSSALKEAKSSPDVNLVPVESITTLYMRLSTIEDLESLGDASRTMSKIRLLRFPELKFLIVVLKQDPSREILDLVKILASQLPEVAVTTRVDPYSWI